MKKKIAITLDSELLKRIDSMGKNRSQIIENLLLNSLKLESALILAGRRAFLDKEYSKAMIPIHGKPVLEHQINMLKKNGIKKITVSIDSENFDEVKNYFGNSFNGVSIEYLVETKPLGTAGPIAKFKTNNTFLVINVDTLMNPDISEIYNFHKKQKTLATILLTTANNPRKYGVAKMSGNIIQEFIEKPRNPQSMHINGGLHIFEPEVINLIPKRHFMIEELFDKLIKKGQLSGFPYDGEVFDVGKPEGYEIAIKKWIDVVI